jgi:hypothetical protein
MKIPDYDKELRALGYVDSGLSGSRGDYFIDSYRPGARKKHKLPLGRVEVHIWNKLFEIHTPRGKFTGQKALPEAVAALQM